MHSGGYGYGGRRPRAARGFPSRRGRTGDGGGSELSVVIPAFNEERRIAGTLNELVDHLDRSQQRWEIVVVDDGSSDRTASVVSEWADARRNVRLESIPHRGKGAAVRHGMLEARGRYRLLCDADLAMPVQWIDAFLQRMEEGYDIVIGSRQIAGARRFNEPVVRHIQGVCSTGWCV